MKEISGQITVKSRLGGGIDGKAKMRGIVKNAQTKPLPEYEGEYVVDPKFEPQRLETNKKSMYNDVTVNEIAVLEVGNLGGGYTMTIGY